MNKSDEECSLSVNSEEEEEHMEQQTSTQCAQSPILERRLAGKRVRQVSDENEEDGEEFVTVRRGPKRLILTSNNKNSSNLEKNLSTEESYYEICMTSKEVLPKQMGLAKLLRKENIGGVMTVKYKNPYRVIIQFDNEEEAEKLSSCTRITELGYRCQSTQKISLSYGVVKNIDLDVEEKELQEAFSNTEYEIVSVRRMKRNTGDQWVNSETVRVCFKGPTLPPYIYSYGCRFKVEPYVFPVSQCSGCWRFGHLIRQCPARRIICPKCGGLHVNCETTQYRCINCKGEHMALSKKCPTFLKEKQIRLLMSQGNHTYKKALNIYLHKSVTKTMMSNDNYNSDSYINNIENVNSKSTSKGLSYKDILLSNSKEKEDMITNEENHEKTKTLKPSVTEKTNIKKKSKKKSTEIEMEFNDCEADIHYVEEHQNTNSDNEGESKRMRIKSIIRKIKDIAMSNTKWEEKIVLGLKIIIEECKKFFMGVFKEMEWFKRIYNIFFYDQ